MSTSVTARAEGAVGRAERRPQMLWDLSSLAFGQLLSVVLGFVGFAYLARTLSPESYGLVEYAVGLAGLATIVIEGGMGAIGARDVARDPARAPELAGRVPAARLLLALIVVPCVGLSSWLSDFDPTVRALIWLFALSLVAVPLKQDWLLQGLEKMSYVAPAQALKSAAFATGVVLVVRDPADLVRVGIVEAVAAFLVGMYFLVVQRRLSVRFSFDFAPSHAWALIRTGASVGASNLLWPLMVYAPLLLVTNLVGSAEAAWLGGVQRIVVALVSFSALYFFNLYPLIARELREDPDGWRRLMGSSVRLIAWSSIGIALITTLYADAVVTTVFGAPFVAAGPVLSLYIWILPLRLLSGHARWTLLAAERQGTLLLVELVCTGTIIVSSVALIPGYGAAGAAVAAVIGNLVGWFLAHMSAERCVGWLPGPRQVLLPLGAAILAAAAASVIGASTAWNLAIVAAAYILCMRVVAPDLLTDAVRLAHAKKGVPRSPVADA